MDARDKQDNKGNFPYSLIDDKNQFIETTPWSNHMFLSRKVCEVSWWDRLKNGISDLITARYDNDVHLFSERTTWIISLPYESISWLLPMTSLGFFPAQLRFERRGSAANCAFKFRLEQVLCKSKREKTHDMYRIWVVATLFAVTYPSP